MVKISDLFDVVYGCNLELSRLEEDESGIPFVSRTSKIMVYLVMSKKLM